jgi:hypothetical protein
LRPLYWLLVSHGIICLLGAFFPFYPPVFLFYWFSLGPFAMKLIMVLAAGAVQVVFGVYLDLKKKGRLIRRRWLAIATIAIVAAPLANPNLKGLFALS